MSLSAAENETREFNIPAEIDWHMLDKSKFFFLGAALFSGVSTALYPIVVLKTKQQVSSTRISSLKLSFSIMQHEGLRGFYRGFGTSLMGMIPARALYMTALEVTKGSVGTAAVKLGLCDTTAAVVANAAAGVSSAVAAQLVWTPIDVVSQRLMVQGINCSNIKNGQKPVSGFDSCCRYRNGVDAFSKILRADGVRGLYRGFGISILTYAPSNAVWWASYSVTNKFVWGSISSYNNSKKEDSRIGAYLPNSTANVAVQATCAAMASGVSAIITMPLDTIKTRLQVLDGQENGRYKPLTVARTVTSLMKEGGLMACYKGLGPRWISMSVSAATMITTYEFLKRLSAKN